MLLSCQSLSLKIASTRKLIQFSPFMMFSAITVSLVNNQLWHNPFSVHTENSKGNIKLSSPCYTLTQLSVISWIGAWCRSWTAMINRCFWLCLSWFRPISFREYETVTAGYSTNFHGALLTVFYLFIPSFNFEGVQEGLSHWKCIGMYTDSWKTLMRKVVYDSICLMASQSQNQFL